MRAIRAGVDAADEEIRVGCRNLLGSIHWATLRAISRRDGVFFGSRRNWDLPAEFASLVTRRVVFRWAELFDITVKQVLDRTRQSCADLLASHAALLNTLIAETIGAEVSGFERLERPTAALSFDIELMTSDITEMLDSARLRFEQELVDNLRERLRPAFAGAAQEFGQGMRERMVSALSKGLIEIAPDVIPTLASDLAKKVAEVKSILNKQVAKSHKAVQGKARIEAKNLETALFERSPAQLLASADIIDGGLRTLEGADMP